MRPLALLVCLLLGACVNTVAQRQAFLAQFVGQPEGVVVQQLGVPSRTIETGGVRYLAYTEQRQDIVGLTPGWVPGPPGWGWPGGSYPAQIVTWTCETTFAVVQGRVQSFTLRGNAC